MCRRNWRKPSLQPQKPSEQPLLATFKVHCSSTRHSWPKRVAACRREKGNSARCYILAAETRLVIATNSHPRGSTFRCTRQSRANSDNSHSDSDYPRCWNRIPRPWYIARPAARSLSSLSSPQRSSPETSIAIFSYCRLPDDGNE